jgi:general secretion pathway protein J
MTRQQGFTLVEMMIALLIFGIVSAAGVALLTSAVRAQAAAGRKLDDLSALQQLDAILTADLAQAVPRPTRDEAGTLRPAFEGGTGEPLLRLVRTGWENPDNAARPGLQKVEYRLTDGVLDRVAYPMLDGAAPLPSARLIDRVAGVKLRYRVAGAWSDVWQGKPDRPLPDAVELRVTRNNGAAFRELFLVGSGYGPQQPGGVANVP